MHISLILDEPKHQISFLKGSGSNPATVITTKILLVNRRSGGCDVTLFIQPVQSILPCCLVVRFNISRYMRLIMTDITGENRLRSINHNTDGNSSTQQPGVLCKGTMSRGLMPLKIS